MKDIQFADVRNYKIAYEYRKNPEPKAVVIMVHGMGEHCWRYDHVVDMFHAGGYSTLRFDLPGHGRSSGKRGHIRRYEEMLDTLDYFIEKSKEETKPQFIFAHSMGGNIALGYLLFRRPKLRGAIIASPWIALSFKPSFIKSFLATILSKIAPWMSKRNQIDLNALSQDVEVVKAYADDDLIHDHISPRLFVEMSRVATLIQLRAFRIKQNCLLYHGSDDGITAFWATKLVASKMKNARFIRYESGFHEMHNEPNKKEVFDNILSYMQDRLSA